MRFVFNPALHQGRMLGGVFRRFGASAAGLCLLAACAGAPVRPASIEIRSADDPVLQQCASMGAVVAEYFKRPSLSSGESEERATIAALISVQERGGDTLALDERVWEGRRHAVRGTAYNCSASPRQGQTVAGGAAVVPGAAGIDVSGIVPGEPLAQLSSVLAGAPHRRQAFAVPAVGTELIAIAVTDRDANGVCIAAADNVVLETFVANPEVCAYLVFARAARFAETQGWTDLFSAEKQIYQAGARMLGPAYVDYGDRWQVKRIALAKSVHNGDIGRDEFDIQWNQYVNDRLREERDRRQQLEADCAVDGLAVTLAQQRIADLHTLDQTLAEMAAQRPYSPAWRTIRRGAAGDRS